MFIETTKQYFDVDQIHTPSTIETYSMQAIR